MYEGGTYGTLAAKSIQNTLQNVSLNDRIHKMFECHVLSRSQTWIGRPRCNNIQSIICSVRKPNSSLGTRLCHFQLLRLTFLGKCKSGANWLLFYIDVSSCYCYDVFFILLGPTYKFIIEFHTFFHNIDREYFNMTIAHHTIICCY